MFAHVWNRCLNFMLYCLRLTVTNIFWCWQKLFFKIPVENLCHIPVGTKKLGIKIFYISKIQWQINQKQAKKKIQNGRQVLST